VATRPTSDRVREAVFDMLTSMGSLEGAAVADLFAGSGALGIEALSRGAASAVFVDSAPAAISAVRANLTVLGDRAAAATVVRADASVWAATGAARDGRLDLVLADPPYAWRGWPDLLAALAPVAGLVVAETGSPWEPVSGWETVRTRGYGSTVVTMLEPRKLGPTVLETSGGGGR
jgi:16S rRNA (guanine966-N2)-methyltransferase